ncbi:MAG: DUF1049 domain-containing protein [Xanthobacteraceae bacterium]|nr:DUF1049 domain-containing protein [Xanthobacteraceae bacterium]MCW5673298.1 DUF1049 domain-containing protein [Xanthobacteraceae bacterium]
MRKLLRWLIVVPLAVLLVLLAVANRAPVTLSLDPFSREAPAFAVTVPLFVALLLAVVLGVVIGGVAAGIGRMRWRYRARRAERAAEKLSAENEAFFRSVPAREREAETPSREIALRQ